MDAAAIPFDVDDCTRLHGGDNSAAFDLHDRGRHAHLVAKVYRERMAWKMAKEVLVYGWLSEAPVPTPRILFADESRSAVEASCALMTRLPGAPASTVTETAGPEAIRAIFHQMGEAIRASHAVEVDRFGYIGRDGLVDGVASNAVYMARQFERQVRLLRDLGGDAALSQEIERRVVEDEAHLAACRQAVLCHNDLHEQNVLVERDGGGWVVTGVLDVENAVAGDPLLDLAKTAYYAREEPLRRSALLDGYGPLPDDGEIRLDLYRLYHALELWTWFARIGRTGPLASILADVVRFARRTPTP